MRSNTGVIGAQRLNAPSGATGVHGLADLYDNVKGATWPAVTAATATIVPSTSSVSEGGTVAFAITAYAPAGQTTLYWSMRATTGTATAADFGDSTISGSVVMVAGYAGILTGTVSRTWASDLSTEGTEAFVLDMALTNGGAAIGTSTAVTVTDTSLTPVATVTGTPSSLNEGSAATYTITIVSGLAAGATVYWVMRTTTGTALAADFPDATLSGSYTVSPGLVNTVTRTWANDVTTEGSETWVMDVRTGSITGTLIGTSSPATTVADTSVPVVGVPTANLSSHYDWSMVTGTSWAAGPSNYASPVLSSGGLAIGLSATTPAIQASIPPYYSLTTATTASGKRYLVFPASSGVNMGVTAQSLGGNFPDITSAGYSFFEVRRFPSAISGYTRTSRWWLGGYSYDFNHAQFWCSGATGTTTELDVINYAASPAYAFPVSTTVATGTANVLHTYVVTIIANTYRFSLCMGSVTVYTGSGTLSTTPTLGTAIAANRAFQLHDVNYASNQSYFALHAMEQGFYSAPLSSTDADATVVLLYNKWI